MKNGEIIVLDSVDTLPSTVKIRGSSVVISDYSDEVFLTKAECLKLVEVLTAHFNL